MRARQWWAHLRGLHAQQQQQAVAHSPRLVVARSPDVPSDETEPWLRIDARVGSLRSARGVVFRYTCFDFDTSPVTVSADGDVEVPGVTLTAGRSFMALLVVQRTPFVTA